MSPVSIALSTRIHNKPAVWTAAYAGGWANHQLELGDLIACIRKGYAFVAAEMTSSWRSSNAFHHADLAVVDIDHGMDLDAFWDHCDLAPAAAFTYTTCSHQAASGSHRFRVVFRLPERISDPGLYKALVTLLIHALGGDRNCTDPCRLFYGNDQAEVREGSANAVLPAELIERARYQRAKDSQRFAKAQEDYDDISLQQAGFVLDHVLDPTTDGERDRFVRITAAAASAGEALYSSWSDWASRGHHGRGKNARQTSERFFRGFSGRSSLATLFFLASEQDPAWRSRLPPELHTTGDGPAVPAAGYGHSDFLGRYDEDPADEQSRAKPGITTPSIFDGGDHKWMALTAPAQDPPGAMASPAEPGDEDDPSFHGQPGGGFDCDAPIDLDDDPLAKRKRKRGRGKQSTGGGDGDSPAVLAKKFLPVLRPNLRLNSLTLQMECGPLDDPQGIHDPTLDYIEVSELAGQLLGKQIVFDVAQRMAWDNRYNPVTTYLDRCQQKARPIDYFETIASELLGVPPESSENPRMPCGSLLADLIMRRFLIGAVARAYEPGCSHSWMPILVGTQNLGKTNFFQYLTPPSKDGGYPWAGTIQQGIGYLKDRPHILHAGWLVLLDEVERFFSRRYTEELKNLVSVSVDRSARKWENERSFPRCFVLAGNANTMDFMVDPTGNRRFMPIAVHGRVPAPEDPSVRIIDLDRVKADRDGIWAAACRAYRAGEPHEFSSYELGQLSEYSASFSVDNPIDPLLVRALGRGPTFIHKGDFAFTMADLLERMGFEVGSYASTTQFVSDGLRRLGYKPKAVKISGQFYRVWIKVSKPESGSD